MKHSHFSGDDGSRLVRDVMHPAVRIEPGITNGDALQRLKQQNVSYGVVSGAEDKPFTIVTTDQLSAANLDEAVQVFSVEVPSSHLTIEPHDSLDNAVQTWINDFAAHQNPIGMIVQEQNEILGVLPREKIEEHAQSMGLVSGEAFRSDYIGYPVGRLEGVPMSDRQIINGMLFICHDCPRGQECPAGPDQRVVEVSYYNADDPPLCKWHQHPMSIKR